MKVTKEIKTIGTLVIVLALISTFYMDDYRQVLEDYPDRQLILITGWDDKVELIGRSHDASIEFYKWKYQDGKTKAYLGSDLVDTVSWQVYVGSKQVKGAYSDSIDYEYNDNSAKVVMKRYVYYDSRRTNFAGFLNMELEIYPNTNKETVTWVPANDSIRYNLLSIHATDDLGQRGKLNGTRVDLEKLQISWEDSADQVSTAYRYLNGKVKIRYKSAYGVQVIDPTITLGNLIIEYWQEDYGGKVYRPNCFKCDLPTAFTFSKNKLISDPTELTGKFVKAKEEYKGLKDWGIELGSNESYEAPVWMPNITCVNETIVDINGTCDVENCTDFGYYEFETRYKIVWNEVSFPVSVPKDTIFHVNLWGNMHPEFGNSIDAIPSILGIDLWEFAWWNVTWERRKVVNITELSGSTLTDFQVSINLTYDSDMQADFSELRFTNSTDDEIDFWLEEKVDSSWAYIWIEVPSISASSNETLYVYYKNTSAVDSASSISNTFVFGDDFEDYADGSAIDGQDSWYKSSAGDSCYVYDAAGRSGKGLNASYITDQPRCARDFANHTQIGIAYDSLSKQNNIQKNIVYLDESAYATQMYISKAGDANSYKYYDGAVKDFPTPAAYTVDEWDTLEFIFNGTSDKITFYLDRVSHGVIDSWQSFTSVSTIRPAAAYSGGVFFVDNVRVRKYTLPFPTYGFGSEESSNTAPTVTANVTKPDTVYTNTDWLVNMTVTDPEGDTLTAYTQFYIDDVKNGSVFSQEVTNNTNTLVATLGNTNFSKADVLIAETWAGDGTVNTSKVNMTSTVQNSVPTIPTLVTPVDNANITDSTPFMNWTISTDADGDTITYGIEFENGVAFSSIDQSNYTLTVNNYTALELADDEWDWRVKSITSDANSSHSSVFEFTLDTTAPTYSLNSTNSTLAGTDVEHRLYWVDDIGLAGYIFGFCNGTWNGTDCLNLTTGDSVTIQLQDADTENLDDVYVNQGAPDNHYGSLSIFYTGQFGANEEMGFFIKYNITSLIPTSSSIVESFLYSYINAEAYETGESGDTYVYEVDNQTWLEQNVTWNNKPSTGSLIDFNDSFQGDDVDFWMSWNVTEWVSSEYESNENNVSFYVNATAPGIYDYWTIASKESSTESSRPYLNVTYLTTVIGTDGWVNSSYTAMTGTGNWSNVTKSINSTTGANMAFRYYTNDSFGNWNTTEVFSYVTTSVGDTCDCPASGNMATDCTENCDFESCDLKGNNATISGSGTVTGFKNIYNYTDITISGGCQVFA